MLDVVYREETLLNVIKSVTRNGRSIILTAVLAVILIYLFSIIGYMFFKDDFIMEVDPALEALQLAANSECLAPGSQCWSSVGRASLHLCHLGYARQHRLWGWVMYGGLDIGQTVEDLTLLVCTDTDT